MCILRIMSIYCNIALANNFQIITCLRVPFGYLDNIKIRGVIKMKKNESNKPNRNEKRTNLLKKMKYNNPLNWGVLDLVESVQESKTRKE